MSETLTPQELALLDCRSVGESFTSEDRDSLTKLIRLAGDRLQEIEHLTAENARLEELANDRGKRQWQPIETAPRRDGYLVLLYPSRGWSEDVNADCEVGHWDQLSGTWLAYGPRAVDYTGPTHWCELPAPPEDRR